MPTESRSPHVQHEADVCRNWNKKFMDNMGERRSGVPLDSYLAWSAESHAHPDLSLDRSVFTLPLGVERFVGESVARALQAILDEVWELNEGFVGELQIDAFVQINGSPEQLDLHERSLAWARSYAARQLARPSGRDRGCQYRRFYRLLNELVPFVDGIGLVGDDSGGVRTTNVLGHTSRPCATRSRGRSSRVPGSTT
jgi:hypothetical protein